MSMGTKLFLYGLAMVDLCSNIILLLRLQELDHGCLTGFMSRVISEIVSVRYGILCLLHVLKDNGLQY